MSLVRGQMATPGLRTSTIPDGSFSYNRLDGLLDMFGFFLDSDIKMGEICVNDVRLGNRVSLRATRSISCSRRFARGTSTMRVCS